jgi:hypothetical protein
MSTLLRWWLIYCLSIVSLIVAYYLGFVNELLNKDVTYLSFVIIGIYLISSLYIGYTSYRKDKGKSTTRGLQLGYYIFDLLPILGLVGTVIGFIFMFGDSFINIDTSNTQTVKDALIGMAVGISTALYTTLVGMIFSEVIKLQLINIEVE